MTLHVVQYSGGIGSWAATQRVIAEHGTANLVLLFADTLVEDHDLYRFLDDSAAQFGVPVTRVADGRTPFEVYRDRRFLGNSLLAPCSSFLKQRPARAWLDEHADPDDTVVYVGLDWAEPKRLPGVVRGWSPWRVEFPMCDPPLLSKQDMLAACLAAGVKPPRLYDLGFSHNNCGGVCVRAGQKHWRHLLSVFPDRYAQAEQLEQEMRGMLGNVAILKRRKAGVSQPLTLTKLREEHERACSGSCPDSDRSG